MDHRGFVKKLEKVYKSMWENYLKKDNSFNIKYYSNGMILANICR